MVNIHNPEGHVSQLVCRLPVKIFISPNLPVDERNEVCRARDGVTDAQLNSAETTMLAPPEYGRHQLDQIYSDIDPAGYMSTAGSTSVTPAGFLAQSRRGSQDNVGFLNGPGRTDGDGLLASSVSDHGSATPLALHLRLADLQQRGQASLIRASGITFAAGSSSGGASPAPGVAETSSYSPVMAAAAGSYSTPVTNPSPHHLHQSSSANSSIPTSGRNSDDDHASALQAPDYNLSDLSRVPSYNAAVRTPGAVTPFVDGPPTYVQAISRPPSPRPNILPLRSNNNSNALGSTGSDLSLPPPLPPPLPAVVPAATPPPPTALRTTTTSLHPPSPRTTTTSPTSRASPPTTPPSGPPAPSRPTSTGPPRTSKPSAVRPARNPTPHARASPPPPPPRRSEAPAATSPSRKSSPSHPRYKPRTKAACACCARGEAWHGIAEGQGVPMHVNKFRKRHAKVVVLTSSRGTKKTTLT
nr:hect-type ubiquitin ligase-interacting protein cred [Quercus suber]